MMIMKRAIFLTALLTCALTNAFGEERVGRAQKSMGKKEAMSLVRKAIRLARGDNEAARLLQENADFIDLLDTTYNSVAHIEAEGLFEKRECKVIHFDHDIVSFRMEYFRYTGGMHEHCTVAVGTLVRGRGKRPLKLEDIATPQQIPLMTKLIRKALKKHFKIKTDAELDAKNSGFAKPGPTQNFYYDKKGLHFVFNEYEIASYAEGTIDICIKWPRPPWMRARPPAQTLPRQK